MTGRCRPSPPPKAPIATGPDRGPQAHRGSPRVGAGATRLAGGRLLGRRRVGGPLCLLVPLCLVWPLSVSADDRPLPEAPTATSVSPAAEALRFDLEKAVRLRQQRGWTIDRAEVEAMLPDALLSLCRVPLAARFEARATLERLLAEAGGDPASRFRAGERDLEVLAPALELRRVLLLFERAAAAAETDCPFYLEPRADFSGRQRDALGLTLHAEGGGLFSFGQRQGRYHIGGGGAGRLSVGTALTPLWHLRVGAELGGAALVDRNLNASAVQVDFLMALPIALRRTFGPWLLDLEAAFVTLGMPGYSPTQRFGGRAALLVGFSTLRVRGLLPWTGAVLMVEGIAPAGSEPWLWSLRAGIRIGFSLQPGGDD